MPPSGDTPSHRWAAMSNRLVLCYHAISDRWPAPLSVSPERLEEQLTFLTRRGYHARTFADTLAMPGDERSLAITFDDAFASVYRTAFPVLRALRVPGTVFVPTALVDTGAPMSWAGIERWLDGPHAAELIGMSWSELGELAEAGWEIGSHTRTHARLTTLGDEALRVELRESQEDCRQHLGLACRTLAYPYGAVDARVVDATRAAGYTAAAAPPNRLPGDRRLRWPRVGVYPEDDLRRFRLKVSPVGWFLRNSRAWAPIARAARRPR